VSTFNSIHTSAGTYLPTLNIEGMDRGSPELGSEEGRSKKKMRKKRE